MRNSLNYRALRLPALMPPQCRHFPTQICLHHLSRKTGYFNLEPFDDCAAWRHCGRSLGELNRYYDNTVFLHDLNGELKMSASHTYLRGIVLTASLGLALGSTMTMAESDHAGMPPRHVAGIFLGGTDPEEGNTEFTFGAEYEFRFAQRFGVGLVYERTNDGHDSAHDDGHGHVVEVEEDVSVGIFALHLHPIHALRLTAGVGMEYGSHIEDEELVRVGAAYDFELGQGFALAPTVNVDLVDGDKAVVFGITLSRHW
jgi:hypothetical protein